MISLAHHLSTRDNIDIICFIFVNPQSNMTLDMPVLFNNFKENCMEMCVEALKFP